MEDFKYKSFKDYLNEYPSLLDNYLGSFEDNIEQDFLEIELKKMKELHFLYGSIYYTEVPLIIPFDYIPPTEEEEKEIEAGVNKIISIKRVIEFLENKINNFNQTTPQTFQQKNQKINRSLIFESKELNLSERFKIANKVLDVDKKIRKLNIKDLEKYRLLAYILGCDKDNARNLMNGSYNSKDRDLTDYFDALDLNK
jgi:hypothetical protein